MADVREGSASESAGLQFMDEFVEVDGARTEEMSVFELCRRFATPGNRKVVFMRGGAKMRMTLILD